MERRDFLRNATIAAGLTLRPDRSIPAQTTIPRAPQFELEERTIAELQAGMTQGRWTARSLAEQYLGRIEAIDRAGPTLASIIQTNPDALRIADELDAERRTRGPRGPLHGVPVVVKDNLDTADRMRTSGGSLALEQGAAPRDSEACFNTCHAAGGNQWIQARCNRRCRGG